MSFGSTRTSPSINAAGEDTDDVNEGADDEVEDDDDDDDEDEDEDDAEGVRSSFPMLTSCTFLRLGTPTGIRNTTAAAVPAPPAPRARIAPVDPPTSLGARGVGRDIRVLACSIAVRRATGPREGICFPISATS